VRVCNFPVLSLFDRLSDRVQAFYKRGQRQFFENGTTAFESKQSRSRISDGYQKKIEALEQKLQRKNEVLSELLEEHARLKKRTWGDLRALWVAHDTRDPIIRSASGSGGTPIFVCEPWIVLGETEPYRGARARLISALDARVPATAACSYSPL
jgi:transposase